MLDDREDDGTCFAKDTGDDGSRGDGTQQPDGILQGTWPVELTGIGISDAFGNWGEDI